jgi:hypothetical protein
MKPLTGAACVAVLATVAVSCVRGGDGPTGPSATRAAVVISYRAATAPRADLPASLQACVDGVGPTHTHPSWRDFAGLPLGAVGSNRWELSFDDVPVGQRVSLRVNDGNACDEHPTGAVTRNVFANDVLLTDQVTTPGAGPEPGFAFTIDAAGRVTP